MPKARSAWARRLRAGALVGVAAGFLAAMVAYARPVAFERGEFWTYDLRARASADATAASPDIVIVDVAEQDIEDVENNWDVTWPWPRELYGNIATYAHQAGARAVVFDWLFQDRGQYSVNDAETFASPVVLSAFRILSGRPGRVVTERNGYTSRNAKRVDLELSCGFTVDGELVEPWPGRTLSITAENTVRFVRV